MRWAMIDTLLMHGTIGVGVALFYVMSCIRRQKVRLLFRFGGEQPFSLGERRNWIRWWCTAYVFEFASSFLFGRHIYVELAASALEACAVTIGFFVVDRVAFMLEDERASALVPGAADRPTDSKPRRRRRAALFRVLEIRRRHRAHAEDDRDPIADAEAEANQAAAERRKAFERVTKGH